MDRAITIDQLGNAYVLGEFDTSADIGGQQVTGGWRDGFVAKLDNAGNFVWTVFLKDQYNGYNQQLAAVTVDDRDADPNNWSIFVGGTFAGKATFGTQSFNSTANTADGFVSKLSAGTGALIWTKTIAGSGSQGVTGIDLAKSGNVGLYVSGNGDAAIRIGNTTLAGGNFLAKYDPATGNLNWAKNVAISGPVAANGSNVVVAGSFTGTVDFDPGAGVYNLSSAGDTDAAVLSLDSAGSFAWADRMGGRARTLPGRSPLVRPPASTSPVIFAERQNLAARH